MDICTDGWTDGQYTKVTTELYSVWIHSHGFNLSRYSHEVLIRQEIFKETELGIKDV